MELMKGAKQPWIPGITALRDEQIVIEDSLEKGLAAARIGGHENTAIAFERVLKERLLLSRRT